MPDLDRWLPDPGLQVHHARAANADPARLWAAAQAVRIEQTGLLGRLIRWRLPGTPPKLEFDALFRSPPFVVLDEGEHFVISGMAGRIWTLRRDYPRLESASAFMEWQRRGTVRVLFAHWVTSDDARTSTLHSEARVSAIGSRGSIGLRAVRPLVGRFHSLIGSEGIAAAVRAGERGGRGEGSRGGH